MNRRNVFIAMLMAPFAALASVRKESAPAPEQNNAGTNSAKSGSARALSSWPS